MKKYNPGKIEPKWQKKWEKDPTLTQAEERSKKRKFYCLSMFPYPSGEGLHVGHVESYTATDILSRYKRMQGFNVLYPIGWDAFGLPAENYAIKMGAHPAKATADSISRFKKQLKSIGLSYDWSREVDTSSPGYYKWTQWFFLFLYKRGLVYKAKAKVNWCPQCRTSLANEQVVAGRCERCDTEVIQKYLEQWFFRITAYAEKLLRGLDKIDWPESLKEIQRNWIGRSAGAEITFEIKKVGKGKEEALDGICNDHIEIARELRKYPTVAKVKVFTTRPDTIFGATFLVLAPDGELIRKISSQVRNINKLRAYQLAVSKKNERERTELNKQKTGICLEGLVAVNPANEQAMPIWVADYVMGDYGSGAIMAVPAHDQRDFEFAYKHGLPVERVIYQEKNGLAFLDLSFIKDPKKVIEELQEKFTIAFLLLNQKGFNISVRTPKDNRSDPVPLKPYGVFIELPSDRLVNRYKNIVQPQLKKNYWSEIIGGKFLRFIFSDKVIKDDSRESIEEIKKAIGIAFKSINKRKRFDPRSKLLKEALSRKVFVADFIPWTIPVATWREFVCYSGKYGNVYNSAFLDGMSVERGFERIIQWLKEKAIGKKMITYRLRDWLVSRQRYWGAPIPIIYCDKCGIVPVPEKDLPVKLPMKVDFVPTGESPLKNLSSFYETKCPKCGEPARREVDTMDTFVCSSWYYYRYCDSKNEREFASQEKIRRFMPVDIYVGGVEHAVLHLLYTRFFTKALQDAGYVDFAEPFVKLRNQGIILGPDHNKMSKSKGNIVNPDDIIVELGADSLRLYEMFMGPLTEMKPWDTKGISGVRRFLEKVWSLQEKVVSLPAGEAGRQTSEISKEENLKLKRSLHRTIKKVTDDIESLSFNTAISQMMILANAWKELPVIAKEDFETFLKLLSPFAPHVTSELWEVLGNTKSIFTGDWPRANPEFLKTDEITVVIQVNGKKRDTISLSHTCSEEETRKIVLALPRVQKYIKGKMIRKWIYIPGKIVNIVVS